MNTFNKPKTIYLFADDNGKTLHDAFMSEEEREDWHAFDVVGDNEFTMSEVQ